ncbi:putative cytochrome P450 [Aspergillus taichungensis]|uniref:Putative cytochrome P450 n=1 Tax=Aspergillus taichungensis TaxID=482145 RepID=A0A2J5HQP9_9EURO|nr:putative cytochrome P450 [Aspergillus taichungensis]
MSCQFYLVGDDIATAQSVDVDARWKFEDLQRAVGIVFHVAQPTGSYYEVFPDHLGNHYRLFRKYGPVIKTTNMGKTTYLTDSPQVAAIALAESAYMTKNINPSHPLFGVKDNTAIFIGDTETENWRLAHKYLPPAMGPRAVRHYTSVMQACARKALPVFDELDANDESFNVYQYMVKLASQTIGHFSFGKDFGHFDAVDAPLHPLVTNTATLLSLNKKITARGEWYRHLPWGDPAKLRQVQHTIYSQLQEAIDDVEASREAAGTTGDLPMAEAALEASCVVDYLLRAVDDKGEHFPRGLILANMLIVNGAGFTTTSALLSWLIYCLVTYEGTQDRLYQELQEYGIVDPANNKRNETTWDPDLAHSMPYLDKFVKETQRLHNASFQPGRTTKTEVVLPGGYRLPPDSVIIPALYAIHTNPSVWRDPFRFDPDRWDTEEVKSRHRCAYIPFATGPRGCIGFNFALLEVKILLSELVSRYEFVREGLEAIDYDPEFQLIRPLNFYVRAKRRV